MNKVLEGMVIGRGATAQDAAGELSKRMVETRRDIVPPDKRFDCQ